MGNDVRFGLKKIWIILIVFILSSCLLFGYHDMTWGVLPGSFGPNDQEERYLALEHLELTRHQALQSVVPLHYF